MGGACFKNYHIPRGLGKLTGSGKLTLLKKNKKRYNEMYILTVAWLRSAELVWKYNCDYFLKYFLFKNIFKNYF